MPPLLEDPRIRQNWNQFSSNAETAAENAAASIWVFSHSYISPCLGSISNSVRQCAGACFPEHDRRQRERGRSHGRAERSFDFYDDWDDELQNSGGSGGILGWGNDELDRLLTGSGVYGDDATSQPGRRRGMSYGTRGGVGRRRGTVDGLPDPTIIPSTSAIGFLGRLPFKLGRTLRYRPSAADLKEHPGALKSDRHAEDGEPLIAGDEDYDNKVYTRHRSSTAGSGHTSDSYRSRGDLVPSDGEDDAVPLDDEFAIILGRRTALSPLDDRSSGKIKSSKGKRPDGSQNISRSQSGTTQNSKRPSIVRSRGSSAAVSITGPPDLPSLMDLQQEEDDLRREEEEKVERKRQAARLLARKRGLSLSTQQANGVKEESSHMEQQRTIEIQITDSDSPSANSDTNDTGIVEPEPLGTGEDSNLKPPPEEAQHSYFIPARLPRF